MIKRIKCLFLISLLVSGAIWLHAFQNQDLHQAYIALPKEVHLYICDIKLTEMIQDNQSQGNSEKLKQLKEAHDLLLDALRKYEYYRTQNGDLLTENWRKHLNWVAPNPNTPDLGKSPLSLLKHLHLVLEDSIQLQANIMVQSRQYNDAEVLQIESLKESKELMKKTTIVVEKILGLARHYSSTHRIYFEAPLEYKLQQSSSNAKLIEVLKTKADGSPERFVSLSAMLVERDIFPVDYMNKIKEKLSQKFPDLSGFKIIEQHPGGEYEFRAKFTYTYTWQGDQIKALVFVHKYGDQAYELNCLALADRFDHEEFDKIIRSCFHH